MFSQAPGYEPAEEAPKIQLPEMKAGVSIPTGGVFIPVNVGRVRTIQGLGTKIETLVRAGLGEEFSGRIRIGAIRGVVPREVDRLLMFALPNDLGGHDIFVDVPRTKH